MEASGPQEGVTYFNATSASNATSIPEESERVLNHLMRLMETLNHVPYLEALSRGSLHGKDEMPVINEAVKKLEVGAHDNATLSVTLYESPKEGGEALPTMQKEFIFVHPSVNTSQDLVSEAGNLHGYISPHVPHNVGGHESQGYRYGQWAAGGRSQKHEQHGRLSTGGAHRHLEDAHGKVHKERAHDKGGQAERKYRVRTEIEYFEREKFKDDEHDKLKAAHRSKASTDAIKGADRFSSQGHQSHQRHLGGGYAQGTQHAVGAGYAPVYVHGAPASGGNKGIDGGSSGFSQKDAQNHEEYHHEAGSQGFTDKDKGHQRAGWRERGYRIIAEKEYVDKDKHHDKAYGVDNQEQGHRLRTQGQHGHKQGHDDVKKAKEHYSHGVHDSAHHEKAHKNRAAYGNNYHVDGSAVDPASTRDHLSSSTSKVAELEAGNATNSPDDTARRKKIIRIRVLSKTPGTASVMIGGHATKVPPESGSPAGDTEESTALVSPPKATSQIDNFGRTYGGVETGRRTHYEQQGYIPGPPPILTSSSRGNHQSQANLVAAEGSGGRPHIEPNSELAVDAVPPYSATYADHDRNNIRLHNTHVNNGQDQSNAYGNTEALVINQVPGALQVLSQPHNAQNTVHYTGNAPASFAQQQQSPVPVARSHNLGSSGQVTSRPDIPYNPYNGPGQDAGAVPTVQLSTYPIYVEGTAVQSDTDRRPIEKPDAHVGYSPHVLTGVNGYQEADNPDDDGLWHAKTSAS
ncbi:hypothetical protein MRX96_002875 [Rhipicephalus microplus]